MIWYLFLATALAASSMVGKQWLISLRREPGRIAIVLVWCMVCVVEVNSRIQSAVGLPT